MRTVTVLTISMKSPPRPEADQTAATRAPARWLRHPDARQRLVGSTLLGLVVFFALPGDFAPVVRLVTAWDAGVLACLILAFALMWKADVGATYHSVSSQDQSGVMVLAIVVIAALASLLAIAFMPIQAIEPTVRGDGAWLFALLGLTVFCSWTLVHTMFALHYAHRYYGDGLVDPMGAIDEGFSFPGIERPDYMDFVYVAFVIGTTAQVSDVKVTTRPMRRLVLVRSIVSFWFYTGILAFAINIIAGRV
jgi:uncharacterized membrane protein